VGNEPARANSTTMNVSAAPVLSPPSPTTPSSTASDTHSAIAQTPRVTSQCTFPYPRDTRYITPDHKPHSPSTCCNCRSSHTNSQTTTPTALTHLTRTTTHRLLLYTTTQTQTHYANTGTDTSHITALTQAQKTIAPLHSPICETETHTYQRTTHTAPQHQQPGDLGPPDRDNLVSQNTVTLHAASDTQPSPRKDGLGSGCPHQYSRQQDTVQLQPRHKTVEFFFFRL
jgi:hypothetical protein